MITEHAVLPVRQGDEAAFEAAFELARPHHFYEPFPVVEHFAAVAVGDPARLKRHPS